MTAFRPPVAFRHEFVESVPANMEPGVLYVSVTYATVIHLCACGCGEEVVTPLSPAEWQLTFDGRSVSLLPSVGNWSLPCRSHYWVKKNEAVWAPTWTPAEIAAGQTHDRADLAAQLATAGIPVNKERSIADQRARRRFGWFRRRH